METKGGGLLFTWTLSDSENCSLLFWDKKNLPTGNSSSDRWSSSSRHDCCCFPTEKLHSGQINSNRDCFPSETPISFKLSTISANNGIFAPQVFKINLTVCCFCLTLSVEEASTEGKWRFSPPEQGRAHAGTQRALCAPLAKSCSWTLSISTTTARSSVEDTTPSF